MESVLLPMSTRALSPHEKDYFLGTKIKKSDLSVPRISKKSQNAAERFRQYQIMIGVCFPLLLTTASEVKIFETSLCQFENGN